MKASQQVFDRAIEALQAVRTEQANAIDQAAEWFAAAIEGGQALYSFGASHSFIITEELVYRTGGLMLVNPIYPHGMNLLVRPLPSTSRLERLPGLGTELAGTVPIQPGDVVVVTSTSGRNAVAIDLALAAREHGARTIAITSLAYTDSVSSRHPDGHKLKDVCDLVIDNGAPAGDASVAIDGFPQRTAPVSTLTGVTIANAIVAGAVERLVERGVTPPVYMSANLDGGDAHNARLLAQNKARIHYL